jgi:Holliday junction resolvase
METTQTLEPGAVFEQFMASMQEIRKTQEETARLIQENARWIEETALQMKETDRRVGMITNRFGEVVEYMVMPNNLVAKFEELGFAFTRANRTEITDRKHNIITEVDALLENGDTVMAVEIKTKPNGEDINDHIERMEKLRKHADLNNDKRKYLGAMAGAVFSESAKIYALKKGFYVIEPSGNTFTITEPKGVYRPRVW